MITVSDFLESEVIQKRTPVESQHTEHMLVLVMAWLFYKIFSKLIIGIGIVIGIISYLIANNFF